MTLYSFNAFVVGGELDLNRLALKLGIARKYRWEEPMRLNPVSFKPTANDDRELVYLYYFGGVVFLNCSPDIVVRFLDNIRQYAEYLSQYPRLPFHEEYRLEIDPRQQLTVTNDCAIMPGYKQDFIDIICFVIAKSVALERIEERMDSVVDEVEGLIANLGKGILGLPDRSMARLASSILSFKYTSIAHIMVLDKPDITWDDAEANSLYHTMAELFELNQRYQEIKNKSEILLDVTEVFTTLSHARRSAHLEWIIIVLIAIEIVIYVLELLRRH
jgi:uncharacterized Rmd1/YagE family protein